MYEEVEVITNLRYNAMFIILLYTLINKHESALLKRNSGINIVFRHTENISQRK